MGLFQFICDLLFGEDGNADNDSACAVNPATGMAMSHGGMDVGGNPFGADLGDI